MFNDDPSKAAHHPHSRDRLGPLCNKLAQGKFADESETHTVRHSRYPKRQGTSVLERTSGKVKLTVY